jgi:hypothetical protein
VPRRRSGGGGARRGRLTLPRWQAIIGGCWVLLGAQFMRDAVELRPAWKCACLHARFLHAALRRHAC